MADEALKIGDLVWAKMKGFSPWPGKVTTPQRNMKRPKSKQTMFCVWFFGSNNFGWIEEHNIKPYAHYKEQLSKLCKTAQFKDACAAIEDYIERKEAGEDVDKMFEVDEEEELVSGAEEGAPEEAEPEKEKVEDTSDSEIKDTSSASAPLSPVAKKRRATADTPEAEKMKRLDLNVFYCHRRTKIAARCRMRGDMEREKEWNRAEMKDKDVTPTPPRKKKPASSIGNGTAKPKVKLLKPKHKPSPRKERVADSEVSSPTPSSSTSAPKPASSVPRKSAAASLIDRPSSSFRAEQPLNVGCVSQTLKDKQITASAHKFGFLGLGIMGSAMVRNLIHSGHKVIVWNRSPDKCKDFVEAGADQGMTPSDVITSADITFSCVSDPGAAKEMVFGNCGVLQEIDVNKAYVEMTGIDADSSQDVADAIESKGGRYLEAQLQGSKTEAEEGTLVVIAAGDRSLYRDCETAFRAMAKTSFFLGNVGNAAKMNLVLQLINGIVLSGFTEGMALADRCGLQMQDVMEILNLTTVSNDLIRAKGQAIMDANFPAHQPLQHLQKDLNLALAMGNQLEQPLPITASANEVFKHAKRLGYGEHDVAAVYIRARF